MSQPIIVFEGVSKLYGQKKAVDNLNLHIMQGETCVLIGPSGCGKTTTLRMINRLVEPSAGRILINGQPNDAVPPEELRRQIGYVIQGVGLFEHLTVAQNVGIVPRLLGWPQSRIDQRVEELLALVGLEPAAFRHKYPRQLSGGEQQRVGVARALAADPPILLMDEPFGALDPITRERLQAELIEIQRVVKKTIVFVTHDMHEALKLADRIAIMRHGRLVQYDTPQAILWQPADEFVQDFVGGDRVLKALGLVPVSRIMEPAANGQAAAQGAATVAATATVRDALSAAILNGLGDTAVVDGSGAVVGWVRRERLLALLADFPAGEVAP
ncbi:MAG: ABC transporter ATP-binding protein [Limnochordales bacterium]|nr:ABC transporter ATP-binding protein [Limnochordales bacterium]